VGQRANRITDVPDQVINDIHVVHIATLLLALFDAAHRAQGSSSRLLRHSASGDLVIDPLFVERRSFSSNSRSTWERRKRVRNRSGTV